MRLSDEEIKHALLQSNWVVVRDMALASFQKSLSTDQTVMPVRQRQEVQEMLHEPGEEPAAD
jgi:hypothetical protein